ncbi:MAG: HD-GYP domain-containing protein [Nitrospinae bacterium]|nr:HD-GYP domain-containing protein [Nitrospinota bacterium]
MRIGEGHAGKSALENRVIYISNLKEEGGDILRAPLLSKEDFISYFCAPLISKGNIKGVVEMFYRSKRDPDPEILDFAESIALQAAIAIDNASMFNDLQRSNIELSLAYDTTIEGWSKALDLRDKETEGHSQRVTEMTVRIARDMGISEEELIHVRRGALLHDIGKMGIPDNILLKPGKLNDEEWVIMRKHPIFAYELLHPISYLRPALDIPYCHHEKWDGTGYPRGLKGEQIPMSSRIFSIVDVWDALRSDRPYRPAWSEEKTLEHIKSLSGIDFDPKVVDVFLKGCLPSL